MKMANDITVNASDIKMFSYMVLVFEIILDTFVHVGQIVSLQNQDIDIVLTELSSIDSDYTKKKYDEALKYAKSCIIYQFTVKLCTRLVFMIVIYFDGLVLCWETLQMAGTFMDFWPNTWSVNTRRNMSFATVMCLLKKLFQFPMDIYRISIQKKFGLYRNSISSYTKVWIEFALLEIAILPLWYGFIMYIVQKLDSERMPGKTKFAFSLSIIYLFWICYPTIIIHCSLKYLFKITPLKDGSGKERILALTSRLQYPSERVYMASGKPTKQGNAFFFGFLNYKALVLFDTLMGVHNKESSGKGLPEDLVEAVTAHELGHWYLNHSMWAISIHQGLIILFFAADIWLKSFPVIYEAFGFKYNPPTKVLIIPGLLIADVFILNALSRIVEIAFTIFQRKLEYAADGFASKQGYSKGLKGALVKLDMDNCVFPNYNKIYSILQCSHPSTMERIHYIDSVR